jgi:hypothetical protein
MACFGFMQQHQERLQMLEAADASGFFCYHLAEHHATPLGMAPSPALFLARRHTALDAFGWDPSSNCCHYTTLCGSSKKSAC